MRHPDPLDDEDPIHRTTEERRDEIVNKRLGRGLGGLCVASGVGAAVLFVERSTGVYLIAGTVALMCASILYMIRTLVRRRTRLRRRFRS